MNAPIQVSQLDSTGGFEKGVPFQPALILQFKRAESICQGKLSKVTRERQMFRIRRKSFYPSVSLREIPRFLWFRSSQILGLNLIGQEIFLSIFYSV